MKNFKSLISIILTAVMLFTAVPSAFASDVTVTAQSEVTDMSVYREAFSSSGYDTSKVSVSMPNVASFKYHISQSFVPKSGSTSDYYAQYTSATNTSATASNGGEIRFGFKNPYVDVSAGDFSISYDFCLNEYTPLSSGTTVMKFSGVTQNGGWLINRDLFRASDSAGTLVEGCSSGWHKSGSATIKKGEWYTITHDFNKTDVEETMTVADSAGNIQTVVYDARVITQLQRLNFTLSTEAKVSFDNLTVTNKSMSLSGLESNVESSSPISFKVIIPKSFKSASVSADGERLADFSQAPDKNTYLVTIPAGTLSMGAHTIAVTANCSGVPVEVSKEVSVSQVAQRGINRTDGIEASTDITTFDSLKYSTGAAVNDEVGLTEIKWNAAEASTPWQTDANAFMVPGPSGKDTDYGLQIRTQNKLVQIYKLDTANPPSNGKLVLDMDILCDSDGTNVQMSKTMGRPDSTTSFMSANKLFGSIEIEAGVWTHVNMVFDFDTSKWTVKANGEEVVYDATSQAKTFTEIRFYLRTAGTPFAIDNARIYNIRYYSGVKKMEYIAGSAATEITTKVPADADAVKLITGEGIDASTIDCITVSDTSGKAVELASVTYSASDKSITITPKTKFPEARGIIVAFGEGTKFADGTPVAQPYSVAFDVESASITTDASFYVGDSNLNVDITAKNIASGESKSTYVLSLRKLTTLGGEQISKLVSLDAKDVSLAASGTASFTLTLDAIPDSGDYEVYLMIIDSFENSKSKAEYIKIN